MSDHLRHYTGVMSVSCGDGIAHIIGIDNSDMRFKTSGGFAFIRDDRVSILIEKTEEAIPLD